MDKPLISIIIPVYNLSTYLEKTLNCVINQTYFNWEAILVDDGSTDDSLDICLRYAKKDERFKVFKQRNSGVSSARNLGLKNSNGDYISFIDGDDYVELNYLEIMIDNLSSDREIVFCRCYDVDKDNEVARCRFKNDGSIESYFVDSFDMVKQYRYPVWGGLYPRTIIGDNLFDEKISYGEDALFIANILKKSDTIKIINKALYFYVHRGGSATTTKNTDNYVTNYVAWKKIVSLWDINSFNYIWSAAELCAVCKNILNNKFLMNRLNKEIKRKILKSYRTYFRFYKLYFEKGKGIKGLIYNITYIFPTLRIGHRKSSTKQ